jgi:hypothetical protein
MKPNALGWIQRARVQWLEKVTTGADRKIRALTHLRECENPLAHAKAIRDSGLLPRK